MKLSKSAYWKVFTAMVFPIPAFVAAIAFSLIPCLGAFAPASTATQAEAVGQLQFNAASLKLADDQNILETRPKRSVGRFRWNTDLLNMLSYAYHIEWWRISGTPALTTIYRLEATTPPNTTQDQVRLMLLHLLIERFHLATHLVTRNINDGYSLTVAKDGARLQPTKPLPETGSGEFDDGYVIGTIPEKDTVLLRGHNASMLQLAAFMQRNLGTSVLDKTDLTGRYDFELTCTRDETGVIWSNCIKRAGLAIEKYKGPVEFLAIDQLGKLVEN